MSTIAAFQDYMLVQRGVAIESINKINSEATSYNTYLTRLMMKGLAKKKMLQGGAEIKDYIQLDFNNSYQEYAPTQEFQWSVSNSLREIKMPWKFALVHTAWWDHEIVLGSGGLDTVFKHVKDAKMGEMELSFWEGRERSLFATPNVLTMEGGTTTGSQWHSLRAYLTEDGLAPSSTNGGVVGADWTTVLGQNPTTYVNWRNKVRNYNPATINTGLPRALDLMFMDVQYESPSDSQQYVQDTSLQKTAILTNQDGYAQCMEITRGMNDRTYSKENDFGMLNGNLTYHGIPIKRLSVFDDAAVFPTPYPVGSPRFWFVNFNKIYPIYHENRFLHPTEVNAPSTQPMAHVVAKDTYGELWCGSRRSSGLVVPSAAA